MIGTVGHYRLVQRLAQGGMGVVYRAEDERLGRQVAVKTLSMDLARDPLALERFRREARTVAALNHPHICTLHDMVEHDGQIYLVMELLDGHTLHERVAASGPIPLRQMLAWSEQIADALGAAHALGIVHRDLKPANIMITARGDLKILDFGVAKLLDDGAADTQTMLTGAGMAVGTIAYMAPEQVRGDTIDARADLFALGAVLYEMATGRSPFAGATVGVIAEAVLNRSPAPVRTINPELPLPLEQIVARLLEKQPSHRYQTAAQVAADLARLRETGTGPALTPHRGTPRPASVAVLPFRNMSVDPDNAFFSDGIAEDLIGALGHIEGLRVVSRASSFRFRDQSTDPTAIGAELGVGALVEGSVRKSGDRLRVTAQLINAADGYQVWGERYDRTLADIFDIQDEIVGALVQAIAPALLGRARAAVHRATESAEAYELYLKGRHYWHQRTASVLKVAVESFEQAIAVDPDFALAYAGVADCWSLYRAYGWLPHAVCQPPAKAAIERAMALGPDRAEVQFAQATYTLYFERDWRASEAGLRRALESNPQWSLAHAYLAIVVITAYGLEAGRSHIERAIELDALSPFVHGLTSVAYSVGRNYRQAEATAQRALELQPDYALGLFALGMAREVGTLDGAVEALERLVTLSRTPTFLALLGRSYLRHGRGVDAARIEDELEERALRGEYIPAIARLSLAVARPDVASVRQALRACYEDRTSWFTVAFVLGSTLGGLYEDSEIGPLVRAMRDGHDAPLSVPEGG